MISTTLVNKKFDFFINTLKDAVDKFLLMEKTYVYASDKPWITGKMKSMIAKHQKLLKFGKESPPYKEACNAVQLECENYIKSAFMTGKLLNLNKTTLDGGGKKLKALLGCDVRKVGRNKCLEIIKSPLSCWLTASTPFWLVLLLTLCRCPKLSLVHFSRSLNTYWLTHVWYTRP